MFQGLLTSYHGCDGNFMFFFSSFISPGLS